MENQRLGKHCAHATNYDNAIGHTMSALMLMENGRLLHKLWWFLFTKEEWSTDSFKHREANKKDKLKERLKHRYNPLEPSPEDDKAVETPTYKPHQPVDSQDKPALPELEESDDIQHKAHYQCISARARVPRGDDWAYDTVKQHKPDANGNLVGHANKNPLLEI